MTAFLVTVFVNMAASTFYLCDIEDALRRGDDLKTKLFPIIYLAGDLEEMVQKNMVNKRHRDVFLSVLDRIGDSDEWRIDLEFFHSQLFRNSADDYTKSPAENMSALLMSLPVCRDENAAADISDTEGLLRHLFSEINNFIFYKMDDRYWRELPEEGMDQFMSVLSDLLYDSKRVVVKVLNSEYGCSLDEEHLVTRFDLPGSLFC